MLTLNQLAKYGRVRKKSFTRSTLLNKNPQKKGTCIKVYTTKPKKPNSATRKIVKVILNNKKNLRAYVPGQGHSLQKHSVVLIRGGRVKDLPGIQYHLIRGKYDFITNEVFERKQRRSKFSVRRNLKL